MDVGEDSASARLKFDMKEDIFAPVFPGSQDLIRDNMFGAKAETRVPREQEYVQTVKSRYVVTNLLVQVMGQCWNV